MCTQSASWLRWMGPPLTSFSVVRYAAVYGKTASATGLVTFSADAPATCSSGTSAAVTQGSSALAQWTPSAITRGADGVFSGLTAECDGVTPGHRLRHHDVRRAHAGAQPPACLPACRAPTPHEALRSPCPTASLIGCPARLTRRRSAWTATWVIGRSARLCRRLPSSRESRNQLHAVTQPLLFPALPHRPSRITGPALAAAAVR